MPAALSIQRLTAQLPPNAQPVGARLALQSLVADLEDAMPRGLPPQALLWMRRLRLQAPPAALLNALPVAGRHAWIGAGREQMAEALAQAARPALGAVPDSAPAVLFADEAEMLACLALAAQAGALDRWWWRALLGRAWPRPAAAWQARPHAQSATRRLLRQLGQGGALAALDAAEARFAVGRGSAAAVPLPPGEPMTAGAAQALVQPAPAMAVAGLPPGVSDRQAGAGTVRPAGADTGVEADVPALARTDAPRLPVRGAREVAPLAGAGARPRQRSATPATALPPERATAAAAPQPGEPLQVSAPQAPAPMQRPARPQEAPDGPVRPHASGAGALPPPSTPGWREPAAAQAPVEATMPPGVAMQAAGKAAALPVVPRAPHDAQGPEPAAPTAARSRAPQPPDLAAAMGLLPAAADAASPAWPWPQALHSHVAPLLFVVNALLEDGLYPDFTRPRDPGLPVPLWAMLAALAAAWRLPPDPLLSVLAERGAAAPPPVDMPGAPGVMAAPWPQWLAAYARGLRRRLSRRLGRRSWAFARALVLPRPAQLWLSEAEWVAEFDLASHDVAWRLAGLDRDPGWLPASGCSLRFVFHS